MSAGLFCCCGGGGDADNEVVDAAKTRDGDKAIAATLGSQQKTAAAPAGHAGLSPPKAARMSDSSAPGSASPIGSDGDPDEYFDARDSLEQLGPKWGPSGRTANSLLLEEGIVLEQRPAPVTGVGRCVIPRHDIPFDTPEAGDTLSWSANPTGQGFKLRGKNYMKDKKKFPSDVPLFEVVQVLALRSDSQTLDFGSILFGDNDVGELLHGCPTVYIANVMLPDYPPPNPVWGKFDKQKGPDGPGQHIIVVARMTSATRAELEQSGGDLSLMSPEVALMARHFWANREADANGLDAPPHGEKVRHCTKMVVMVAGGQDSLPWAVRVAIGQGNGKPFMVNKTGFFTKREGKGYFEIGVNAHNFGPVATNGLRNCHNFFKTLVLDIGVTLQGASTDELPERLLFSFRAVKPDLEHIVVHINELEEDAKENAGDTGPNARPWIDWEALRR